MYYNVFFWFVVAMTETEQTNIITLRLSKRNLTRVEAVQELENLDRSTLLKEFIEDGLRDRVVRLYADGKLSAGRGAEILGVSLREFLELLERKCVAVSWDTDSIKEYMKSKYGE
jgi:predicted HTH domain antitoxin